VGEPLQVRALGVRQSAAHNVRCGHCAGMLAALLAHRTARAEAARLRFAAHAGQAKRATGLHSRDVSTPLHAPRRCQSHGWGLPDLGNLRVSVMVYPVHGTCCLQASVAPALLD